MKKGFFIGRFQPYHLGHEEVIKSIARECGSVIVGIGSAHDHYTVDNPFTAKERFEMISRSMNKGMHYTVVPIPDIHDHQAWVGHIESLTPKFDVVYTGNKIVRDLFEKANYEIREINHHVYTSATQIRNMICKGEGLWKSLVPQSTLEVLAGCDGEARIIGLFKDKFKKPSVTVDALVTNFKNEILLIKRRSDPFKGMWALPGGYVDFGENTEKAVERELKEETNLDTISVELAGVYSEPGRDPRSHVISIVYQVDAKGEAKAGDDAKEIAYFSLDNLPELAFDHKTIIEDWFDGSDEDWVE